MIEENFCAEIAAAFADRKMPKGRILLDGVDLSLSLEASRVDDYFRRHKDIVDRHNSVIVAFNYLTPEAGLWILPNYMLSIIKQYRRDDFIIDVVFEALASQSSAYEAEAIGRGLRMRRMATLSEVAVVCRFCRWLKAKRAVAAVVDDFSTAAIQIWCN